MKPSLSTTLSDKDQSHKINCGKDIELTDKVHFENLIAGYEYKMTGFLVDRLSGEPFKDKDGNEYKTTITFKADKSVGEISLDEKGREVVKGDVYVNFKIDSGLLFEQAFAGGATSLSIVCTETLYFRV